MGDAWNSLGRGTRVDFVDGLEAGQMGADGSVVWGRGKAPVAAHVTQYKQIPVLLS